NTFARHASHLDKPNGLFPSVIKSVYHLSNAQKHNLHSLHVLINLPGSFQQSAYHAKVSTAFSRFVRSRQHPSLRWKNLYYGVLQIWNISKLTQHNEFFLRQHNEPDEDVPALYNQTLKSDAMPHIQSLLSRGGAPNQLYFLQLLLSV